ncbi:MAG TPA: acetyl-CoA carboxylase biotin carboxyl carrier protein subunit, partial [Actinomycetes bacterium]
LAGTLTRVAVTAGQRVAAGDLLAMVEAMKMETPLRAPFAATVVAVPSAVGAPVAAGQVVVELDPAASGPEQQGNR